MRIVLFGLTGFGNAALRALRRCGVDIVGLVTRRETGEFPHYREIGISAEARQEHIPVYDDLDLQSAGALRLLQSLGTEFLFVSSFHQKIPATVIDTPARAAINLHPSLLPAYRGATPPSWCLFHGEKKTGVTAHFLTEQMDQGAIIAQQEIGIDPSDTNGTLRYRLARLTEEVLTRLISRVLRNEPLAGTQQDESRMSYQPRWTKKDAFIDFSEPAASICRRIRASSPYPGAHTTIDGEEFQIDAAWITSEIKSSGAPGTVLGRNLNLMTVAAEAGVLQLLVSPSPAQV